jgi:fibronectin-binding autotransporter adhesin
MKKAVKKNRLHTSLFQICRHTPLAVLLTGVILALAPAALAGNGTPDYLDLNGSTAGFGTPSGVIDQSGANWDTSASGTGTPAAFASGDQMTFTNAATDATGGICAINLNSDDSINGVVDNCTNSIIQLGGTATADSNDHFSSANIVVSVVPGSTLIWADTRNSGTSAVGGGGSGGFNMNKENITFSGGGTNTFNTYMGANCSLSNSLITLNGATINLNYSTPLADIKGGNYAGGFTLTSGALNFQSAESLDAFNQFLTASNTFLSINGGTIDNTSGSGMVLEVGNKVSIGGSFTFNGSSPLDFGTVPVTLATSPTIDVNASTLAFGGTISGSGNGLTLTGNGTLQLYGANTYTGNTIVGSGTLALTNSGSISGSPLVVNDATFDISGESIVAVLPSLSFTNSTLVVSELSTGTTNILAATLNVGGTANTINITSLPLVMQYPTIFPIIQGAAVSGTLNFGLGTLPTSEPYGGYITNIQASGVVALVLTTGPAPVQALTWSGRNANTGLADGTWDVGNTPDWLGPNGVASTFGQLDLVTFNDAAAGSTVVNLGQQLTPGSLTVSNNVLPYTFTGGYLSDGTSSLTLDKEGAGTLMLQESGDNFSGGIHVGGGKVVIDNSSASINGGVTIGAGATVQLGNNDTGDALPAGTINVSGTLAFNCADTPTVANVLSGDGSVEQLNTNVVTLSGDNTGNFAVTIMNGTLQAANNSSLGNVPGGSVTITNGGTFDVGGNTTANTVDFGTKQFYIAGDGVGGNGTIINSYDAAQQDALQNITLTTNATIGGPYRWDLRNGTPVLNLAGYTLTKTNANQISMVGVQVSGGNIVINQGILSFEETPAFSGSGTITVNAGGFVGEYLAAHGSVTREIVLDGGSTTNLSGSGEVTYFDCPILLEANSALGSSANNTAMYDGVISDGGSGSSLINAGAGTNLLAGTNSYSGSTLVTQGTLGLTGHGSIAGSPMIVVNNGSIFDISTLSIPFSGTNALWVGDDTLGAGTLNLGAALVSNFNYLSISNAVLNMAVVNPGIPNITVTNLDLGDGGASSTINITALPPLTPAQFPLIKYANATGTYSLNLGPLPTGYSGNLVNDTANNSIDLAITAFPAGIWNGGGSSASDDDWSDSDNWSGTGLTGTDPLVFTGTAGLNNTNDVNETATSVTFFAGAGDFVLNGNPITLSGNIANSSSNPQTINLGLNVGLTTGTNFTINAGTAGMVLNGGITNTSATFYNLHLQGTNGVLAAPLQSIPGGSPYDLEVDLDAVAGAMNTWSIVGNNASFLANLTIVGNGSVVFGTGTDSPVLTVTNANGFGAIVVGATTNTASSITMNSGTMNLTNAVNQPLDLGTVGASGTFNLNGGTLNLSGKYLMIGDAGSSGTFNQNGGMVIATITNDVILGNSINNSTGAVNLAGGTFDATADNSFFVGFRGKGTWNISSKGLLEVQTLNMTRNSSDSDNASGTLNLNGGTVIMDNEFMGNAATGQTGAINFNGGVLEASAGTNTFIAVPASPSVLTTTVKAGGAIINDGGFAITIATPLIHDSTLGGTADGGLVKIGPGTLTLSATNTYSGSTIVSNGTLLVSGSLGTNGVNVATADSTLAGTGTIGGSVVNTGTIAPGTTTTCGLLNCLANVTNGGASTNAMKLDINNATNDTLSVSGTLTYGGTLSVDFLSGAPGAGSSFKLFSAATVAGSFTATNLPALADGLSWIWDPATGTLSVSGGVNTNPATADFKAVTAGRTMEFSWAPDHLGWQLYTNSVGVTASTSWFPVAGSSSVTNETITINPSNPKVFFQLRYP